MPRKKKKTLFKDGKRGAHSGDSAPHFRRWFAIEVLLRKDKCKSVREAAEYLVMHPSALHKAIPRGGSDADMTGGTICSADALRASHTLVKKDLKRSGIDPDALFARAGT
jgi:hypothetical protein